MSAGTETEHAGAAARTASIVGTGMYVPERVVTNRDLEEIVDTSDEWIFSRTGMRERRIAAEDQATSDLAAEAAKAALADAGVAAAEVDQLITATLSPDMIFPSTACLVQHRIGADRAACFDLGAACSGFLYALEQARCSIASGAADTVLVIGAEKMSAFLDWEDRSTCVLFGDGAGAAVLRARGDRIGVGEAVLGADGSLAELLCVPAGGSRMPASEDTLRRRLHCLRMEGREVYKHAVSHMVESVYDVLRRHELDPDEIACFIPHQANARIIQAVGARLDVEERMFMDVERYGNTSAAALAIALHEAVKSGTVSRGELMVLVAFGGGFTWGANIVECTL
ncbi:beta-ketoacyl-ACP synthase III [Kiritimatiella glycovorans]|uniref:Beta-ketoacyl-[acyl-carrier-protein] synthase III n=1 Tax=Kiritimatiella glycovorans TaxID=1307763 RepID=A0A0G3EH94_9BACT|nr:beta-ketoacyl-ACP synthase III [Kiritimatiella glycovorans]AKJ63519.1 3-oxoacyl-[acyl-carrier-protein] synthase 3 [Kiritimatiella glycovorans]